MVELTEEYVKSMAFNDSTFSNAKKLVSSGKMVKKYITKEKDLIFGECSGSGKSNYVTSVDFINPNAPVFRCNCPSRQIPCKHSSALLYAYYLKAENFEEAEIPEDVLSKREKIEKRVEKKKEEADKPKKVNVSAFVKKMEQQLQGIQVIENFIKECFIAGFASISLSQLKSYQKELVNELGNYYIPSLQAKVVVILDTLEQGISKESEEKKYYYQKALTQLTKLEMLIKKSKQTLVDYIEAKKVVDAQAAGIFTKMGYIWKLEELKSFGFVKENRELIQLSFYQYDDVEEKALVDVGYYIDLEEKPIYKTLNIRPYKLLKRIEAEDTLFERVQVSEYAIYPGEMNRRIRWEGYTLAPITQEDLAKVREKAQDDFKTVLKEVKNQLKDPLADEHPVVLLKYKALLAYKDEEGNISYGLKDSLGETLLLGEVKNRQLPPTIACMKYVLQEEDLEDQIMLGMFEYQAQTNQLILKPLSVITKLKIKRLLG